MKKQLLFVAALLSAQSTLPGAGVLFTAYQGVYGPRAKTVSSINDIPNNPHKIENNEFYKIRCTNGEKLTVTDTDGELMPTGGNTLNKGLYHCYQCNTANRGYCMFDPRTLKVKNGVFVGNGKKEMHLRLKHGKAIQHVTIKVADKKDKKDKENRKPKKSKKNDDMNS